MTQAIKILKIAVAILTVVSTLAGQPQTPFPWFRLPISRRLRAARFNSTPGKTVTLAHCGRYRLFLLVSLPHQWTILWINTIARDCLISTAASTSTAQLSKCFPIPTGSTRRAISARCCKDHRATLSVHRRCAHAHLSAGFRGLRVGERTDSRGLCLAQVPYASANPGAKRYTGWSAHGEDYIEPPVVGEDGYAYLRLYEMTGNTKYLRAAIRCANALVKNYKAGNEKNSPWPVRCYARDGKADGGPMGPYSANVIEPIMLFDELIRLGHGDVAGYARVRAGAWTGFRNIRSPITCGSVTSKTWRPAWTT